ncbi:hypothetical protein BKA65DRAFT_475094 [Rhexocercosporidium sp. MPI-PUGE-AT-0058]|nr:hypothetical protein BKA65DRAFT_475094 [Rhexocercosporidium sp. MPI-PUGE-AT-0058]
MPFDEVRARLNVFIIINTYDEKRRRIDERLDKEEDKEDSDLVFSDIDNTFFKPLKIFSKEFVVDSNNNNPDNIEFYTPSKVIRNNILIKLNLKDPDINSFTPPNPAAAEPASAPHNLINNPEDIILNILKELKKVELVKD